MQDIPLSLDFIFRRAEQLWGGKRLLTVTPKGVEATTYCAWADRTRRLGGALDELAISPDGRVATFAWNTSRHLELYFAPPCTGRVLHTINIRLFADQITYIVNHAEDEVIFVDRSLLPLLLPAVQECRSVRHIVVMDDTDDGTEAPPIPEDERFLDYEELLHVAVPHKFGVVTDENRAASMCYTSGTTGDPKGVVYSHRSVVLHSLSVLLTDQLGLCESDVCLPVVPMFHANAWGLCQAAVLAGAEMVFPGADLSPEAIAELIVSEGVTFTAGVPTIWRGVKDHLAGQPHKLRKILGGGSAVPKSLSQAYLHEIGLPILQAWGMTETSPVATVANIRSDLADETEEAQAELRATQGMPVPLVELRIVDPESGDIRPWDGKASGEVQVRGPWIARKYYEDARGDAQFTSDGWLRTGDVGIVNPDGYVRLVDRTKDLIKSGGEWISSVDLENEIMAHPAVVEAAVIAVPSERWIERPVACVVVRSGESLAPDELRSWLESRVAKWWLPDVVEFLPEIPKTSVGKFSKRTLRERFSHLKLP